MGVKTFINYDPKTRQAICQDTWKVDNLKNIKKQLDKIQWPTSGDLIIDGRLVSTMDSGGAWLLYQLISKHSKQGVNIKLEGFSSENKHLISLVEKRAFSPANIPKPFIPTWLAELGRFSIAQGIELRAYFAFVGLLTFQLLRRILSPAYWRLRSLVHVIDTSGYKALPIIALLSFMIGVVIAYQMGNQLRNYGASVFIVNLLGLSVLREFGPLITAIMVAGRTGSAFTAEIGIMKINQEIDALDTMGVASGELLVLPRILGLFIVMPLLTMWANMFGVLGGMLMANNMLGISFYDFLHRFQHEIPVRALLIGMGKAPVFALIIASIGCFQGMQVQGSAESVGKLTTRSVVLSIFFIIVVDAIFSVIFSRLGL